MKFPDWNKLRNSFVYITPHLFDNTTRRFKFSLARMLGYISIYTFFSWLIFIMILGVTPLKDFLFVLDEKEYQEQTSKVQDLQDKVAFLTKELQKFASTNERIKLAMKLAEKDSIDSANAIYDSLKKPIFNKLRVGGNILVSFRILMHKMFEDDSVTKSLIFQQPSNGFVNQQFEPAKGHLGIDYGLKVGSPVYASAGGYVIFADYTVDNGYMLILQHKRDFITIYKHCSSLLKRVRDVVEQGELIALSGNSGKNTTGPHLHFEIWQGGKPIDPEKILIK